MTPEERFERIEPVTAGLAEQAKADREENRQLLRDTQRQLDELAAGVNRVTVDMDRLIVESAARDEACHKRDEASRQRDAALDARVDKLVSAIGEFISSQHRRPQ